ncbi:TPA: hypothetical protein HA244_06335 [Candidatus Micrarchaeota archaeon]|nr:hypothetical protein [Candidatus Micrarchaeota archaeon]
MWLEAKVLGEKKISNSAAYYEQEIVKSFFSGNWPELSKARKAVSDFSKASGSEEAKIDLMVFYVETGTSYTLKYGDIDEPFYSSLESMFFKAVKTLNKSGNLALIETFKPRLQAIVKKTEDMGWGYHDNLADFFEVLGKPGEEKKLFE